MNSVGKRLDASNGEEGRGAGIFRQSRHVKWGNKMKMRNLAAAGIAAACILACPVSASASEIFDLSVYDAGFTGSLGTVTVDGQGTSTLNFNIALSPNVFFQMTGNGNAHDAFWFSLKPFTGAVTTSISTPNAPGGAAGGDYPTGGQFTVARNLGGFGQGFSKPYDYGAVVSDSIGDVDYYGGPLVYSLTANDGSLLYLTSSIHNGSTVYGGADLRQCLPNSRSCTTGPVGFTAQETPSQNAVPEPATWAMMLFGFGAVGAGMRRRRKEVGARVRFNLG